MSEAQGCGAPAGGAPAPSSASGEAVIEGHVRPPGRRCRSATPAGPPPAGVRPAEVPLGQDGGFRFFAAPGTWTVRVLAPGGVSADRTVTAGYGHRTALEVSV